MARVPYRKKAAQFAIGFALALSAGCVDLDPTEVSDPGPDGLPPTGLVTETAGAETHDAEVPIAWFRLSFDLTRTEFLFPPVAARAYAYAGVALWEAVAPGVPGGRSLAGQLNGLAPIPAPRQELYWPAVANAVLARIMGRFYTSESSRRAIRELEQGLQERFRREIPGSPRAQHCARATRRHGHLAVVARRRICRVQ